MRMTDTIALGGATVPFMISSGLWVLTIIGYLLGPETRGKELESISTAMDAPVR
jgi:MFS transporter, putative metabolite:H+ symporter